MDDGVGVQGVHGTQVGASYSSYSILVANEWKRVRNFLGVFILNYDTSESTSAVCKALIPGTLVFIKKLTDKAQNK